MEISKKYLEEVLIKMSETFSKEKNELYTKFIDSIAIDEINNIDDFYFFLIYSFNNFLKTVIKYNISDKYDVSFIFLNYKFIDTHISVIIGEYEGFTGSKEKSHAVIDKLLNYYITNEKIEFSPECIRPEKVLNNHHDIINFYISLSNLINGDYESYISQLKKFKKLNVKYYKTFP